MLLCLLFPKSQILNPAFIPFIPVNIALLFNFLHSTSILLKKIFINRNLTYLWAGQVASQSGDSIYQIGLIWLALEMSGSEAVTGLVAMSMYLPAVALSIFAGAAADRMDRRRIMLFSDGFRTVLILFIPAAFYLKIISPGALAVNAFAIAIAATFFNPSRDAFIPQIVPSNKLVNANSLIQTSWQFSLLIGPAIAGLLLHLAGKVHLFTFDALFYALSFFTIWLIGPSQSVIKSEKKGSGFSDIKQGFKYVYQDKIIFPLLIITMVDNLFIMGPAIVGAPVFVKEVLNEGAPVYALLQGCYAIGMLAGTALLLTYGKRFKKGKILLVGIFLDGVTFIPLFFAHSVTATAATIIIHSLAIPLITVSRASIIQDTVPGNFRGRVFALINIAVVGMSAVSSGLAGIIMEQIGAPMLFFIIGIDGGLCGIAGWMWARKLREKA